VSLNRFLLKSEARRFFTPSTQFSGSGSGGSVITPGSGYVILNYDSGSRYLLFYQRNSTATSSVADPGCLSRIPDPDFYPSRIPDLGSRIQKKATKERGEKKFLVIPFYVASNFTKLNIILVLKC
jgi:hypothetical protein